MPELPEVETVARQLRAELLTCTIVEVQVLWERTVDRPDIARFCRALAGATLVDVTRRGKFILMKLDTGQTLLSHLRMTGQWLVLESEDTSRPGTYDRVRLALDDGRMLVFVDTRKFGRMYLVDDPAEVVGDLGPEPLAEDFTPERLAAMLARRKGRIKALLLNQSFIAGLGNIYADEALWRAMIHPLQRADRLSPEQAARLHAGITSLLTQAIDQEGTSLRDNQYRQPDGTAGGFQDVLAVYGRAGQSCPRCGTMIERIVVGQRGTHFCPHCQVLQDAGPRAVGERQ
jgi:formamidopyrimidine-DNA glycosylase